MNSNDFYDNYKDNILLALPKYTYSGHKVATYRSDETILYTGKAITFLNVQNMDTHVTSSVDWCIDLSSRISGLNFDLSALLQIGNTLTFSVNLMDTVECTVIDKFVILDAGVYFANVPTIQPTKLVVDISNLLYLLAVGDISSSYQVIGSISAETKNLIAENRQNTTTLNTRGNRRISAWTM